MAFTAISIKYKMMRFKLILIALLLFSGKSIYSQCLSDDIDVTIDAIATSEACTNEGGTNAVTITWELTDVGDLAGHAPAGSWGVTISFPASGEYGITGTGNVTDMGIFDWYYDSGNKTLKGYSNADVDFVFPNGGANGSFTINVEALSSNGCSDVMTPVNIFLTAPIIDMNPSANACLQAFQNDDTNDSFDFSLGVDVTLPINMSSFRAKLNDCKKVDLEWTTVSEIDNAKFILERKFALKEDFVPVTELPGAGTSNTAVNYTYTDELAPDMKKGTIYYRLKQVDFNGNFTYSSLISLEVDCEASPEASVFPNPVVKDLNIQLPSLWAGDAVVIEFYNEQGKLVRVENIDKVTDLDLQFNISELPTGIYNLKLSNSSSTLNKRFVRLD